MQYKEILENISDWLWTVDTTGKYTYCSKSICDMIGYSREEVIGKTPFHFMDEIESLRVAKLFGNIVNNREAIKELENTYIHKDGSKVVLKTSGIPVYDKDGTWLGYEGIDQDITHEKNLEEKLKESKHELLEQNTLHDLVFKSTLSGVLFIDIETGKFIECNPAAIDILGYECKEDLLNLEPAELSPQYQADGKLSSKKAEEIILSAIQNGSVTFEWQHLNKNKEAIWVEVVLTPVELHNNKVLHVVWKDIAKRKKYEELFSNQHDLLLNIVNTVPVRIYWKDKEGNYLGSNKLFLNDVRLNSQEDIIGKNDSEMQWSKENAQLYKNDDLKIMQSGIPRLNFEVKQTDMDGNDIIILLSKVPLEDSLGNTIGILGSYTDITEQRIIEEKLVENTKVLKHQAHHDSLTGLANRALFNERLVKGISKAKRNNSVLALLFIDLDHFKEINDSLGHDVGDIVLNEVSKRLQETIRLEDSLARLGGDEFTVILEDLKQGQDASLIASKILTILAKPIIFNDSELYISSSIGISLYPDDGESVQSLLKFADSAMYKAKDEGRNNYQYYDSKMTELAVERVVMEASLRQGIKNEEFVVYYQAQVNGENDDIVGMEALVRWNHPTMGLLFPDKFISLAESTGLIVELDRFVMKTAMHQLYKWYEEGFIPGVLAMNLSIKQLRKDDFIETLENLLIETKCKPQWLELEVTEGQIMTHPEESIKVLQQVSNMGIELAVDDFGTGYSSLSCLKRLPIDKLKIDQSFIKDVPGDEEDVGITKAVIALAKSLNLNVVGEGAETKEQKDFLVQNGCSNIQGYYYSKPISAVDIEVLLKNGLNN